MWFGVKSCLGFTACDNYLSMSWFTQTTQGHCPGRLTLT